MENENTNAESTVTIKKSDLWKYSTFVLIAVLIVGGFFMYSGRNTGNTGTGNAVQPTGNANAGTGNAQPTTAQASANGGAVLGNANAPTTIIEFTDFQCVFCRKFWTETLPQIEQQYVNTGKVKLVVKNFPLSSLHPMAEASAEAAQCVREMGGDTAFFKYHDKMFSEQNILDSGSASGPVTKTVTYTTDNLKKWAKDLGYDIGTCLDSGKYGSAVAKDAADAQAAGGQGTPFFVIMKSGSTTGTPLSGAYPFSSFQQVIDSIK